MGVPWWAKVAGGQAATKAMADFNATPALANAWLIANKTRLNENPELGASVLKSGMDYATARRLDMAYGAGKAQQKQSLINESGSSNQMVPSQISAPAASADVANQQKTQQQPDNGFWSQLGSAFGHLLPFTGSPLASTLQNPNLLPAAAAQAGDSPWGGVMKALGAISMPALSVGDKAFTYGLEGLQALSSPFTGPESAGSADKSNLSKEITTAGGLHIGGPLGDIAGGIINAPVGFAAASAAVDYGHGAQKIAAGVDPQQAQDLRNQGYNPDSWLSRYNYYANYDSDKPIVSNTVVDQLKQQFNPTKVDMVREVLTSGALTNYSRTSGLSENAQTLLQNIQNNKDPEASKIMTAMSDPSTTSLGGHLADIGGLKPGTTSRALLSAAGDLAGYWFLDPTVVAGRASNAYKMARYGVQLEPDAVKAAIIEPGPIANRWNTLLDKVDQMHVLASSPKKEDQAAAAAAYQQFQIEHSDIANSNVFSLLTGMRSGAVQGALFKAPTGIETKAGADMTPVLGIHYAENPSDYKPMFQLRQSPGDTPTADGLLKARVAIAEHVGDALVANAMQEGRPFVNGQFLMPGGLRVTTPVRKALNAVSDVMGNTGSQGLLFQQLKDAENRGILDFAHAGDAPTATSELLNSPVGGQWVRENYTRGGVRANAAMALSRFHLVRDAAPVSFTDPSGLKAFSGLVKFIFPKGQAALLAHRWATVDPASRSAMWNQLSDTMANARNALDTQAGRDYWKGALKGTEQIVPPGGRVLEAYSSPDTDLIKTPAGDMSAAMYSTQFASGARAPSLVNIVRNTESAGILSWLTRVSHGRLSTLYNKLGKVGQVGTTSNMQKQVLEGRVLQGLEDPAGAARAAAARIGLSANAAEERVGINDMIRQARTVLKSGNMEHLTPLAAQGRTEDYIAEVQRTLQGKGQEISPLLEQQLTAMDLTKSGIEDIAAGRSRARLAVTKAVDPLRTMRANTVKRLGIGSKYTSPYAYNWLDRADDGFYENLTDGMERLLGDQRGNYVQGGAVEDMAQVHNALDAANRFRKVKLRNTQGYLGAAGDVGAQRWGNALGYRLADPVGKRVHELVAHYEVSGARKAADDAAKAGTTPPPTAGTFQPLIFRWSREDAEKDPKYQAITDDAAKAQYLRDNFIGPMRQATAKFTTPEDFTHWFLSDRPEGEKYRLEGRRGMYINGKYVSDDTDKTAALKGWSAQMVEDARRYLGLRTVDTADDAPLIAQKQALLDKVAEGGRPSFGDLEKIPDNVRPEQVQAPIVVGKQAVDPTLKAPDWLGAKASQAYELFVGGPMRRLLHDPQTAAARWEAMVHMEPLAEKLAGRGMSNDGIYRILDTLAAKHAVNRIARYSDNPHATSYFAALSNNFLWYERAMEDFARRAIKISRADPAVFGRAHAMTESAEHAGIIYRQNGTDDEGSPQSQWMFTWPGSGLAMKAVNESAQRLGLVDSNLVKTPVWQDFASPVTYLSPSLSNPIGFSTNPMLGIPLKFARDVFPSTAPKDTDILAYLQGGERSFANQGQGTGFGGFLSDVATGLLPVYAQRAVNALNPDDRDSETASALKNALIYMDAAGKLPSPNAPAEDRQNALDELRQQVQNITVSRAIMASFLPATPGTMSTDVNDLGNVDEFDKLRGINSVRSEWFQLLEDMTQKYGSDQAMSEASTAWLQRGLGSIIHPEDFTVGTSGTPGDQTGKSFASSQNLVQWMLDNRGFLHEYGQAAYKLLPSLPGDAYYNQIGYQTQLRTGLRQHKDSQEFYNALIQAQGDRSYYASLDAKDHLVQQSPQDQKSIYNAFDQYVTNLKTANPLWAQNEAVKPDLIYTTIAPMVQKMANATDLPAQIQVLQPKIKLMAQLYDDYRSAVASYPGDATADIDGRRHVESQYRKAGDALFKGTEVNDLWSSMKVYET